MACGRYRRSSRKLRLPTFPTALLVVLKSSVASTRKRAARELRPATGPGVVLDHTVEEGNPPDAPQLAPAVARVIARVGRPHARLPPTAATARPASRTTSTT